MNFIRQIFRIPTWALQILEKNKVGIICSNNILYLTQEEHICRLWVVLWCDGPLYTKFLPRPVVDKWPVSGKHHFKGHKKKIPSQIVDITNNLLLDELCIVLECGSIKPQTHNYCLYYTNLGSGVLCRFKCSFVLTSKKVSIGLVASNSLLI